MSRSSSSLRGNRRVVAFNADASLRLAMAERQRIAQARASAP
jgi:hypothetical protein